LYTHVMRHGVQFTNIQTTGNTNKDPISNPLFWMACPTREQVLSDYQNGTIIPGGSSPIHDFNHADYEQYFSLGKHRYGGADGVFYEAYGVHLDGQGVGSGDLSDIIEAWHLKDVWAPGSIGARTLVDSRGTLLRAVDLTGGQADSLGERLEDQMQGFTTKVGIWTIGASGGSGNFVSLAATSGTNSFPPVANATDGTPRTGTTTRDKSITTGLPYAIIMVAV